MPLPLLPLPPPKEEWKFVLTLFREVGPMLECEQLMESRCLCSERGFKCLCEG